MTKPGRECGGNLYGKDIDTQCMTKPGRECGGTLYGRDIDT